MTIYLTRYKIVNKMKTFKPKTKNADHFAAVRLLNTLVNFRVKFSRYIKMFCYLFIFTGIGLVFNSCVAGWVASEPSYGIEYERPVRPGEGFIWIDGGWRWDRGTHDYIRHPGYWSKPRQGHTYVKGYWRSGARGKSWVNGHWSRDNGRQSNHDHNDRHDKRR